jgi:O-antigen ligase
MIDSRFRNTGLILVAALFFVWPVPRTMSVRELLLVLGLGVVGYLGWRAGGAGALRALRVPGALLAALTLWILVVAMAISGETAWSLDEIRGHWLKPLVAVAVGVLAAFVFGRAEHTATRLVAVLGAALLAHVVAIDVQWLWQMARGAFAFRATGLTDGSDKANYLGNMLFALVLAELFVRHARGARWLPLPGWAVYAALLLTLFSFAATGVRNGVAVAVALVLCWGTLYLWQVRARFRHPWLASLAGVALIGGGVALVALAGVAKPGSGWKQVIATVPVALDTQGHKGWLNQQKHGLPTLADDGAVDESAYLRIAWFKEGLALASDHPWGVGFGRNAFGHAISAKYGEPKGHSHSGFIDLLAGIGIPGVLLWYGFLLSLAWRARTGTGTGLAVFFVVADFAMRSVIDSNIRDHMLQQFLFLAAVLATLTAVRAEPAR